MGKMGIFEEQILEEYGGFGHFYQEEYGKMGGFQLSRSDF